MKKSIVIYVAVIWAWYALMDAGIEPFKNTGLTWLAALIVGAIFVIGNGIIGAIKENKDSK
jgi:cell division protein FtsX